MSEDLYEGSFALSRYAGPEHLAVDFNGKRRRTRYQLSDMGSGLITLDIEEAARLGELLHREFGDRRPMPVDELTDELLAMHGAYLGDAIGMTERQRRRLLGAAAQLAGLLGKEDTDE